MRESCQSLRQLLEVATTAGGCDDCRTLQRVAGEAGNMTENALSILIVLFPHNSNKLRPHTESCVFSNVGMESADADANHSATH